MWEVKCGHGGKLTVRGLVRGKGVRVMASPCFSQAGIVALTRIVSAFPTSVGDQVMVPMLFFFFLRVLRKVFTGNLVWD